MLGKAKNLPSLRTLRLAGTEQHQPDDLALRDLMSGSLRLTRLEIAAARIQTALPELADCALGVGLEELCLIGQHQIADQAAPLLRRLGAAKGALRRLEAPRCFGNRAPETWNPSVGADLESLTELVLDNGCAGRFFEVLASAWFVPQITELSLAETNVSGTQLDSVLEADWSALERLSFRDCEALDAAVFQRVIESPIVEKLRRFDVGGCTDLRGDAIEHVPDSVATAMRAAGWPR